MTVTGMFWLDGNDIHLLPGLASPRLDQLDPSKHGDIDRDDESRYPG